MSNAVPMHLIDEPGRAASVLHPTRLRILSELAEPDSAAGVARKLDMPRQQVNYHLRLLEDERLVEVVGERQKRGCTERLLRAVARSYVISPATLGALAIDPARIRDQASSAYLVAVASQTIHEVADLRERATAAGKRVPTLALQSVVRFASPDAQHSFAQELAEAVARIIATYHDEGAPSGRRFRVMAGAYPAPADSHAGASTTHTEES